LLRKHRACDAKVVDALTRTPKMRSILKTVGPLQPENTRRGRPVVSKRRPNAIGPSTSVPSLPQSRYNRVRLYEEVWAEPTQKVAKLYGVSDVAIAKACTLLDIPKPPRGYWAKKAAGRKLPIRPLLPKY